MSESEAKERELDSEIYARDKLASEREVRARKE